MRITLTGASGFIGARLVKRLQEGGNTLHILGRRPPSDSSHGFSEWDAMPGRRPPLDSLAGADAIVHLAGEPVAQRWSDEVKRRIRESRVSGTKALVEAIGSVPAERRPRVLVAASAIGYYGDRGDETLTESARPGSGFLPEISVEWENASRAAEEFGVRVAMLRIGIVLGSEGGALTKMLPFFRMGAGGPIGSGRQWMSWIHVDDLAGLVEAALTQDGFSGPINATAPNPVTNTDFTRQLGLALHRPAVAPTPRFALRLLFGEMAEVILSSLRVIPEAALAQGFQFRHPELPEALRSILR